MVMEAHKADWREQPTLEDIVSVDTWARGAVDAVVPKADKLVVASV
jgi:hypothetical protein